MSETKRCRATIVVDHHSSQPLERLGPRGLLSPFVLRSLRRFKMKCAIPEISWHNRDPVLSIDLQPQSSDGLLRLATGGTDSHVLASFSLCLAFISQLDSNLILFCSY
jgi:hypothetical protein